MRSRKQDQNWVWIGLLFGFGYVFKIAQIPDVGLSALSIFFAGLLAVASLLPSIQNFAQIKFIKDSGHINDLITYIKLPLYLSFFLIVTEIIRKMVVFPSYDSMTIVMFIHLLTILILSLWGVFLCSLFRLILIIPKIIADKKPETKN